jgi:lactate dehydrogenase-like 2-hydroxyacid dehydrogenase
VASQRPRVFVSRRLPGDAVERLAAAAEVEVWPERLPPPPDELARHAAAADGLLVLLTDRVDAAMLDRCRRLRVVANMAVGYDNLDVDALTARGIPAGNTPGVLTESTAELTWALILAATRRVVESERAIRRGEWVTWEPGFMLGRDLAGGTLGIVGFGKIGAAVARRAHAFDLRVLAWTPRPKLVEGVEWVALDELLARSDVVSVHCALTPGTRGLIGARALALMKPSAVLVNTARGPIVDQAALAQALRERRIFAAALDVVEREPIAPDDPLLSLDNCLVVPHIGSATVATRARMAAMAADNVLAGLRGERLPNCVNPEVYG